MQNGPLLSVIIPVYGVEKYIAECLDSVMYQTYKNLEILVINDGTKDQSAVIAKKYACIDDRIKVYDFENGGISVARNRGIELANGKYVTFLDSDDWIELDMYRDLVEQMEKEHLDMIKCAVYEVFDDKSKRLIKFRSKALKQILFMKKSFDAFLYTVVWNGIYTRDLVKKVKFPEGIINEDNYVSGMYQAFACKQAIIQKAYYNYRVNSTGISKGGLKRPLDKSLSLKKLIDSLREIDKETEIVEWQLACELYHYVRRINSVYRVIAIRQELYDFLMGNLDIRRRVLTYFLLKKRNIKVI